MDFPPVLDENPVLSPCALREGAAPRNRSRLSVGNDAGLSHPDRGVMPDAAIECKPRQGLHHHVRAVPIGLPLLQRIGLRQEGETDGSGKTGCSAARPLGKFPMDGVDRGQFIDDDAVFGKVGPQILDLHRFRTGGVPFFSQTPKDLSRNGQGNIPAIAAESGGRDEFHAHVARDFFITSILRDLGKGGLSRPGMFARVEGVTVNAEVHFVEGERFGEFFQDAGKKHFGEFFADGSDAKPAFLSLFEPVACFVRMPITIQQRGNGEGFDAAFIVQ